MFRNLRPEGVLSVAGLMCHSYAMDMEDNAYTSVIYLCILHEISHK